MGFPPEHRKCRRAVLLPSWERCYQNLALGGREGQRYTDTFRVFEISFNEWVFIACAAYLPMVVIIVPEKKKALARSHWLTKVLLLIGSTPAPMALTTSWDVQSSEISSWVKFSGFI